jgi:hypothetical protein
MMKIALGCIKYGFFVGIFSQISKCGYAQSTPAPIPPPINPKGKNV